MDEQGDVERLFQVSLKEYGVRDKTSDITYVISHL